MRPKPYNPDEDVRWLVLFPRTPQEDLLSMPGAVVITANCGHKTWIAPSSRVFLALDGADTYTVCTACFPPNMPDTQWGAVPRTGVVEMVREYLRWRRARAAAEAAGAAAEVEADQ
jgi:hypothetical protein